VTDWIYQFLAGLGYNHPIHPALVHIPIGNIVAAFVFSMIGLLFRRQAIGRAGYYALVLAFVSLFFAAFFGVTDWLQYFAGAWLYWIKIKIVLASALAVVLLLAIIHGRRRPGATIQGVSMVFVCLLLATGLGYYGANLVYSGIPVAPTQELREGRQLFEVNCHFCHPQGGNVIKPQFPLIGSARLSDLETFTNFVRNPVLPGGQKGEMPRFTESKISEKQLKDLYEYITRVLQKTPVSHKAKTSTVPSRGDHPDSR